ncbi:MAG: Uma2 family endonuclease [Acidimicrobiales bacterium]
MATRPATRRFTVDDYYRMADAGVLGPEDRVELIDGEIIEMAPIGSRHATCVRALTRVLSAQVGDSAVVSVQSPVRLDDFSEPEPDVALLRPPPDRYASAHPEPADVLLLVEVADTTQSYDRSRKLPRYAAAGIAEVWLVDLATGTVEAHRDPARDGYASVVVAGAPDTVSPHLLPGVSVEVADLLA